jgi:hypothetical protein
VRKLWCTGAIAGGMLLLGAAPAWAGDTPAAEVIRTVPAIGIPFAGLPMQAARFAQIMPDDGALPAVPAPDGPPAPPTTVDPDSPAPAPTVAPTAGIASVSAPPPVETPGAAAPTPSVSVPAAPVAPAAFAAEQRPKAPALPALDDPRLLEEPVDGFVNREKWKH